MGRRRQSRQVQQSVSRQSWRTVSNGTKRSNAPRFEPIPVSGPRTRSFPRSRSRPTAVSTRTRRASTASSSFFASRERAGAGWAAVPARRRRRARVRPGRRRLQGNRLRATSAPLQRPSSPDRARARQVPAARRDRRPRHKPRARRQRVHRLPRDWRRGWRGRRKCATRRSAVAPDRGGLSPAARTHLVVWVPVQPQHDLRPRYLSSGVAGCGRAAGWRAATARLSGSRPTRDRHLSTLQTPGQRPRPAPHRSHPASGVNAAPARASRRDRPRTRPTLSGAG